MKFSIRLSYPENNEYNWSEALQQYAGFGCFEVAFYSTELFLRNVNVKDVINPFKKNPFNVSSVHMAHARITDYPLFELVLERTIEIARALGCRDIVVHPSKGEPGRVMEFIENTVDKILDRGNIYLCWETFTSRKRFLSGAGGIAEFCKGKKWHKMCYDFSHIHDEQEVTVRQISKYLEYIKLFHISNRISAKNMQHLPLFHKGSGRLDLNFLPILKFLKDKDYKGALVLEYLPEFHSQLLEDALFLVNKFIG